MAEVNPGTANLIAYWSLDELSGTRFDTHGSNNLSDAGAVGNGTLVQGKAADFEVDGSGRLTIADNAALSFGDEDFSFAIWVKTETQAGSMRIIGKWEGGGNNEYLLYYDGGSDRFIFTVSNDGTATGAVTANNLGAVANATKYLIIPWHDSVANTLNIQVNNGTVDSQAYANGCNDNTSTFVLGGLAATGTYDGLMDEGAVDGQVWTADEREWIYNSGNGRNYAEWAGIAVTSALMHRRTRVPGAVQDFS